MLPSRSLRAHFSSVKGERHCISAVAFMVAGGGFEPPTFGLCDLTHLSMRVGLYLHPHPGIGFGIAVSPVRVRAGGTA